MNLFRGVFSTLMVTLFLIGVIRNADAAEVLVRIDDVPSSGTVCLALFNSANTFGDFRTPAQQVTYPVDGQETFLLSGIPAGEYALLVYHDENDNLKLDKNFIGIPTEPLGFSNGYRPKGPPNYSRAVFVLAEEEQSEFTVELYRPLGERGRIGVGPGMISRSSPYRDYDGGVAQVIPAISFAGDRLQILGPNIQFGLLGTGKLRVAAAGSYRIGVYDENDSDYLEGMGDRDSTFMAGLAVQAELPEGFDLALSYKHDVLDNIGGGEARIAIDKLFQVGAFRLSPELGINWISNDLANHDFGVPDDRALPGRPAYDLDSSYSFDIGLGVLYEITTEWLIVMNVATEFFGDEITDSPIVSEDYVIKGFFAVSYLF